MDDDGCGASTEDSEHGDPGILEPADRLKLLERYLARRIATGRIRPTVETAVVARWVLETVTWFGWHRNQDRDAALHDDDRTLLAITELVCDALIVHEQPPSTATRSRTPKSR